MESNVPSDGALATSADSIVSRIESLVLFFLHRISEDPENDSKTKVSQDEAVFPGSFAADNESNTATDSPEFLFPPLSNRSIQRSASLLAIMRTILSLHAEKRYSTLRHMYYSNVTIAPSQRVIDRGVAALTQFLKTPREELRITSTSKCIIKGPITIQERTSTGLIQSDCGNPLESRGHLVSSLGLDKVLHASEDIRFVLVVEKETIFYSLIDSQFMERHGPCVLLTGKGFPDISARSVLWHIHQRFGSRLPIFLLTDFDPHGLLVAMTYAFPPRKATRYYFQDYSVPSAVLLALPSADEAGAFFGVPLSNMSTMSDSKRNLLPGISDRVQTAEELWPDLHPNWRRQLIKLRRTKATYTLDVLKDLPRFIIGAIDEELSADDSEKSCADCSQA